MPDPTAPPTSADPAPPPAPIAPPAPTTSEPADAVAARLAQRLDELVKHLAAAEATLGRLDALVAASPAPTTPGLLAAPATPSIPPRRPALGMSAALPPATRPTTPEKPTSGDRKAVADYLRAKRALAT